MIKVVEIKESLGNRDLLENMLSINQLSSKMIRTIQTLDVDVNIDDFNYINIIAEKSKMALEKAFSLI